MDYERALDLNGDKRNDTPLKLFVGQIPKDMNEEALIPIFEDAGAIAHMMVIRDRQTKAHRGCAFLTYMTREAGEKAIAQFHNKVKLPNAAYPVQMRPADSQIGTQTNKENKLFVGMLPPTADEAMLRKYFSKYGELQEVYVMRNKGCAFVKFQERSSALLAIAELHETTVFEGATRPLVVKFADNKKVGPPIRQPNPYQPAPLHNSYYAQYQQAPQATPTSPPAAAYPYVQQASSYMAAPTLSPYGASNHAAYAQPTTILYYTHPSGVAYAAQAIPAGASQYDQQRPPSGGGTLSPAPNQLQASPRAMHYELMPPPPSAQSPKPVNMQMSALGNHPDAKPEEGPPGANLFIYHLPNDVLDQELITMFLPYGKIVSAKVYMDKKTGESKGFGFVSFDSPESAEAAIAIMNGFHLGSKRLKVQHKKVDPAEEEAYQREKASRQTQVVSVNHNHNHGPAHPSHAHAHGMHHPDHMAMAHHQHQQPHPLQQQSQQMQHHHYDMATNGTNGRAGPYQQVAPPAAVHTYSPTALHYSLEDHMAAMNLAPPQYAQQYSRQHNGGR